MHVENECLNTIMTWFSKKTFGIYLIHIYFVYELPNLLGISNYNLLWRIFGGFLIFFLCSLITDILLRIPVIKRIIP